MNIPRLRNLSIVVLLIAFFTSGTAQNSGQPPEKDGKLVVLVTWGDLDSTPATNAYVEAHGYVPKYGSERSFVLKMSRAGRYEVRSHPQSTIFLRAKAVRYLDAGGC